MGEEKVLRTTSIPQGSSGRKFWPAEALLWGHKKPEGPANPQLPEMWNPLQDSDSVVDPGRRQRWLCAGTLVLAFSGIFIIGFVFGRMIAGQTIGSRLVHLPFLPFSAALSAPRGDLVVGLPQCPDWGRWEEEGVIPMG